MHTFNPYMDIYVRTYRPWLLEVNASPSLTANTQSDYEMKAGMLDDVLSILDLEKYLTGNETQVGGFDLVFKGGLVHGPPPNAPFRTYLGTSIFRLIFINTYLLSRSLYTRIHNIYSPNMQAARIIVSSSSAA
jgi:hypothetical protein